MGEAAGGAVFSLRCVRKMKSLRPAIKSLRHNTGIHLNLVLSKTICTTSETIIKNAEQDLLRLPVSQCEQWGLLAELQVVGP